MRTKRSLATFLAFLLLFPLGAEGLTTQQERKLGDKLLKELRKKLTFLEDPVVSSYVDQVGRKVVEASGDGRFPYRFFVVEGAQPNAFTIPGGYVFINTGLLGMLDAEDELAAVLAHEVSHSVLRHISRMFDQAVKVSLASVAIMVAGALLAKDPKARGAIGAGAAAMAQSLMLKYSREHEMEADQLAASILDRAQYHPQALVSFLKKVYRWSRYVSPEVPSYLNTHPAVAERVSYLSARFPNPSPLVPSLGLRRIKGRIAVLQRGAEATIGRFWGRKDLTPDDLYTLGVAFMEASRWQEAVETFERLLKLEPSDPYARRELGLALYRLKDFRRAEGHLRKAFEAFPADAEVALSLIRLLRLQKGPEGALGVCEAFLHKNPQRAEFHRVMGELLMERGEEGLAHEHFGLFFMKRGNKEAALYHLQRAYQLLKGDDKGRVQRLLERLTAR